MERVNGSDLTRNFHLADYQYEIIMKAITDFEKDLDDDHEVAAKLSSFGQTLILNVKEIGYSNPSLIHFYGTINEKEAALIQHVSQINFLLMSVKKANPNTPARRIGFNSDSLNDDV